MDVLAAEWARVASDADVERAPWYRLVSETEAKTVVVTKDGFIQHVADAAASLASAACDFAIVLAQVDGEVDQIEFEYLEDLDHAYSREVVEVFRLPIESLGGLLTALVDIASGVGSQWVNERIGTWTELQVAWRLGDDDGSRAARAVAALVPTIASRWAFLGEPTEAQAEVADSGAVVAAVTDGFDREELLVVAQRLVDAIVGLAGASVKASGFRRVWVRGMRIPFGNPPFGDEPPF